MSFNMRNKPITPVSERYSPPFFSIFICGALLLGGTFSACAQYDLLIRNGKIIDGTGNSWYYADVAVKNGKIAKIGKLPDASAKQVLDAKGNIVAPGFIDVHAHIENGVFENPNCDNYVFDGVTTVITGNCGGSADDLSVFFQRIDSIKTAINVARSEEHHV